MMCSHPRVGSRQSSVSKVFGDTRLEQSHLTRFLPIANCLLRTIFSWVYQLRKLQRQIKENHLRAAVAL
jgi:hypothetical protein